MVVLICVKYLKVFIIGVIIFLYVLICCNKNLIVSCLNNFDYKNSSKIKFCGRLIFEL